MFRINNLLIDPGEIAAVYRDDTFMSSRSPIIIILKSGVKIQQQITDPFFEEFTSKVLAFREPKSITDKVNQELVKK